MITFKSIGHFWASAFKAIVNALPKIEATKATVETVTGAVPGGAAIVPLEDAGYMVLGEIASIFTTGGDAAKAKLADAGMDVSVIQQIEAVVNQYPSLVALAKSAVAKKA